ncbi:unnamed protein product [Allacma fusca]|uniref:Carboxylic ester hydrolase n=1 Tax=Allacma fusca TaxID=39272 RepID=A0A8J2JJF1_9HEXA|nr:unnamed protein product [Allacma fusca]
MLKNLSSSISFLNIIIPITVFLVCYLTNYERSPVIEISTGRVQGFIDTARNGRKFQSFFGIPYAEPPVGKLRFESPQPAKSWNGTLDATIHASECKGYDFLFVHRVQGEESCLFLDVLSPMKSLQNSKALLPVIVYIHGGGFQMGSSQKFDGRRFMDQEIVLVVIQYRLGIFGFLTTGDDTVKGNMGLKDQVLALKWVKTNIVNFGGNPNQVTIMGDSAGGCSVHLLMLSPMAKGLFHRAITMNIVGTSDMVQYEHSNKIETLAEYFKCPKTSQEFVDCLRKMDADTLAAFQSSATFKFYNTPYIMGPSIESNSTDTDAFLTQNPLTLMKNGEIISKVPWMVGMNENEGLIFVGILLKFLQVRNLLLDDDLWAESLPHLVFYDAEERHDAAKKIKEHFFGDTTSTTSLDETKTIQQLGNLITEKVFMKPMVESVRMYAMATSAPVYFYQFNYRGLLTSFDFLRWTPPIPFIPAELTLFFNFIGETVSRIIYGKPQHYFGPSHGDEIILLFQLPMSPDIAINYFDLEMSQLLVKTYADFATFDQPTFQGLKWPSLNPNNSKIKILERSQFVNCLFASMFSATFFKEL